MNIFKTEKFSPRIRPNILPEFCEFEIAHTWNVVSGTGGITATTSNLMPFNGLNSIKVNVVSDGVAAKSAVISASSTQMQTTITKDGSYALGLMLGLDSVQIFIFGVEVWINGIKTEFKSTFTSDMGLRVGQNPLSQTLDLENGDVVDFKFAIESKYSRNFYIDGFKLELIDDNIYAPSPYSVTPYNQHNWHRTQDFASSQVIPANTRTKLLFVGSERKNDTVSLIANNDGALVPSPDLRITPTKLLASLGLNGLFTTPTPSGANQTVIVELESNSVVYRAKTHHFSKTTGVVDTIDYVFIMPVEEDFLQYGGHIYITSTSEITISNRYLFVEQNTN